MEKQLESMIVGDIVATDFRTAAVFDRFGIDFCCGGRRSVREACQTAHADVQQVVDALETLPVTEADQDDVARRPADALIQHILDTHHAYIRAALPTISAYLAKLETVHGGRHPELVDVHAAFEQVAGDLEQHMMKEEHVLFPYIVDLAELDAAGRRPPQSPFGTVENPIRMMEREHQDAADEMRTIRTLTHDYAVPPDGCTTYSVCMSELARFERDLHRHVHLENNVLFPKAIALEQHHAAHM